MLRALLVSSLAASALAPAAGPRCRDGSAPRLTGDPFDAVHCALTPAAAPALPPEDAPLPAGDAAAFLKSLAGRWEAVTVRGLGRYEILLAVSALPGGRVRLAFDAKELQLRTRASLTLVLTPGKEPGRFTARLTGDQAPGASLDGAAAVGAAAEDGSRRAELAFSNGAKHRLALKLEGGALRLKAVSALPGAPLAGLETTLTRTKRAAL